MELWEILVPCQMREKPVRTRHHRVWDDYVLRTAGGLTILKPGSGKWMSPSDLLHQDRVIPVRIARSEEQIKKIASFTLKHYHQEAVMFYRVADKVSIVYE